MRVLRVLAVMIAIGSTMMFVGAGAAHALEAVPLPMTAPPGAPVTVTVSDCPAGTTDSAALRFRAAGGAAPAFDPSEEGLTVEPVSGGGATLDFLIPTSTQPGDFVFDVFCVSEGGGVTDGPESVPLTVALLPVTVAPNRGPHLTRVTVTGGGCPTGLTDQVFIRIRGASDDVPPFDATGYDLFSGTPNADGTFSISFAVPTNLSLGENQVESFCISEGGSVLAGPGFGVFVVEEGELARTGRATGTWLLAGLTLVLVGFSLSRRPRAACRGD